MTQQCSPDIVARLRKGEAHGVLIPCEDLKEAADEIERLRRVVAFKERVERVRNDAQSAWQPMGTRPPLDEQPGRQFILIEGWRYHSGLRWHRQFAGEAWIRKPGEPDEKLQYRKEDVLRICKVGDIDPESARVTHWMPGKYPDYPALSSAQRGQS